MKEKTKAVVHDETVVQDEQKLKVICITWNLKGDAGKTLTAVGLWEAFDSLGFNARVFNCDNINGKQGITAYKDIGAESVTTVQDGKFFKEGFDYIFNQIIEEPSRPIIIDMPSNFGHEAFIEYSKDMEMIDTFISQGWVVVFNVMITAMEGAEQSKTGVQMVLDNFPNSYIYLWLNEFKAADEAKDHNKPSNKAKSFLVHNDWPEGMDPGFVLNKFKSVNDRGQIVEKIDILESYALIKANTRMLGASKLSSWSREYKKPISDALDIRILNRDLNNFGIYGFDFTNATRIRNWKKEFLSGAKKEIELVQNLISTNV